MSIYILNQELSLLGALDIYESKILTRRFHRPGEFSIKTTRTAQDAEKLQKGNILMFSKDGKKAGIIEYREVDDETGDLIIRGSTLEGILSRRATVPLTGQAYDEITAPTEEVMKTWVSHNAENAEDTSRNFPNLIIEANQQRGQTIDEKTRYKSLSEELERISLYTGLGWCISIDVSERLFVFDTPEGIDRSAEQSTNSPVIFSREYDNIKGVRMTLSEIGSKNIAIVGGQGEGISREIAIVGSATGFDRREIFIDARDVSDASKLPARGEEKLAEYKKNDTVDASVLVERGPFEFEKDYFLGDIVTVISEDESATIHTRITEVTEIEEAGNISTEIVFGKAMPTISDKIKQLLAQNTEQ